MRWKFARALRVRFSPPADCMIAKGSACVLSHYLNVIFVGENKVSLNSSGGVLGAKKNNTDQNEKLIGEKRVSLNSSGGGSLNSSGGDPPKN